MSDKEYIAKFRSGSGSMGQNAIDYFRRDGKIIKHSWAMGGETFKRVKAVPESIEGYELIKEVGK